MSDGATRRQVALLAADLLKLAEAVVKAKEHFGMPNWAWVVRCYEAGRAGFWLRRHLISVGIENEVVDSTSGEPQAAPGEDRSARRGALACETHSPPRR